MIPFLIKQNAGSATPTMRYQQVYDASLFTNVSRQFVYVSTMTFFTANFVTGWILPSMQINLSTTSSSANALSLVFSNNVGPDDRIVFGPASFLFPGGSQQNAAQVICFATPFKYDPSRGNLLLDVRILDGSGVPDPGNPTPDFFARASSTDECSRIWTTNVAALSAEHSDSVGLSTAIEFSPIPTLTNYISSGGGATRMVIQWPSEPGGFLLQRSSSLGSDANWQVISSGGACWPNNSFNAYAFPFNPWDVPAFFRLIGPGL
jgi:hypothetical protein